MLSQQKASIMLTLQAGMNSKVDPDWLASRYPYLLAVVIEGAEAIEHHGWKWWKLQHCDLAQLQMELIDIWHFLLSALLLKYEGNEQLAGQCLLQEIDNAAAGTTLTFDGDSYAFDSLGLVAKLELLIGTCVSRRIEIGLFAAILQDCDMDWNELYRQYVGKNVLNFFRQDNGYKDGHYRKVWHGREDNEHLVDVLLTLNVDHPQFQQQVYDALLARYPGDESSSAK